jgi:four helix bundle protein
MNEYTNKNKYDLEERTSLFGENIIDLCKIIPRNEIISTIIKQLIRSATSIGANYMEANGASSKKDFRNKIFICKKESQETKYWIRMLARAHDQNSDDLKRLWQEAKELSMIFHKITSTIDNKH